MTETHKTAWRFSLPFLPPSVNHSYVNSGSGRRVLRQDAKDLRDSIGFYALASGFRLKPGGYAVHVTFTFPTNRHDIDGPVKHLLDGIFGTAADKQVWRLVVDKSVEKGVSKTEVEIEVLK